MSLNYRNIYMFYAALLVFMLSAACSDLDDDFSSSTSDLLTLPADTLNMDTLISQEGSRTYSFSLYNRNSKGIVITSVYTAGGANSAYRINVDGSFINEGYAQEIKVRSKDSIKVWVEVTPPATGESTPQSVSETLYFVLQSNVRQQIYLNAWGQDVVTLKNVTLTKDTLFSSSIPYHVYGNLTVEEGATLTLAPGTVFYFHNDANLVVRGCVKALGERGHEIVFRGDRLDYMFTNQPYDLIPGRWGGIDIQSSSYENQFAYCDIHGGDYGIKCDSASLDREKLRVENSVLHNVQGDGLNVSSSRIFVGNSQITNAGGNCVTLYGGQNEFVHCTIANFYPFTGKTGKSLYFYNTKGGLAYPLVKADFMNCIITGSSDDEIFGTFMDDETVPNEYLFKNCLLNTDSVSDSHFEQIKWDRPSKKTWGKGHFRKFDLDRLTFDFHLDSLSSAINSADVVTTSVYYLYDRDNVERLTDGCSDMGCYEFVSPKR